MNKTERLLERLNAIGRSLAKRDNSLGLIGLGSVGLSLERLDGYSDLDFFVIVSSGSKRDYLEDLSWLDEIAPIGYCFANSPDGYKLFYQDGIFCEFAVFEMDELEFIPFTPGRVVWKVEGVEDTIAIPRMDVESHQHRSMAWLIGEILTNLYVGLMREHRGETLSAMRFIQGYAVDRILELEEWIETPIEEDIDSFDLARRFESRFPSMEEILPRMLQGYARNRESALAVLRFLETHFEVNPFMKDILWNAINE